MRRVVHRQQDAGDDHDHQHDPGERAEIPPVVQVPRRRILVQLVLQHRDERQAIVDPADDPARCAEAGLGHGAFLTDRDRGVGGEFVRRHQQVQRRRPLADSARGVVDRAVARAEPAAVGAAGIAGLLTERDAAEMRADADDDQPLGLLDAGRNPAADRAGRRGSTSLGALISSGVRWSIKTGLPRHATVRRWPTCTGARSTSVVDSASVSLAGFRLSMNGQIAPRPRRHRGPSQSRSENRAASRRHVLR